MAEITDRWYRSELGCHGLGATLDEILAYRRQLQDLLGEDCQSSFRLLEEALYPLDIGPTTLANVCTDQLPGDLATLAEGISQPCWGIFVLGLNS